MAFGKIIAGPILRRVENNSVSVWIACSQNLHLTLKIYDADSVEMKPESGDFSSTSVPEVPTSSSEATTVQFGNNLWIAVVTAVPQVALQSGRVYSYNILLESGDDPFLKGDFLEDGLLTDKHQGRKQEPLGYKKKHLPSFVLANEDPEKLFVVQASCRKMHGHGHDALAHLDATIKDNLIKPDTRPQQLFLTGDQVYADDVPGPLLRSISVLDGFGIGISDSVRVDAPGGETDVEVGVATWPPYLRQHLMAEFAGFTSGSARNHVIGFGEFCGLYLAYWNLRSWNTDLLELIESINSDNKESVALAAATRLLDSEAVEDDPNLKGIYANDEGLSTDDFELCLNDDTRPTFFPESSGAAARDAQQQKLNEFLEKVRRRLKSELKKMAAFAKVLPKVSRVLANVPSYMIFDDHEVTDDWYLSQRWKNQVLSKNLGRDVIRNGLMAYAVFQDWGNVPDEYVAIAPRDEDATSLTARTRLLRRVSDYAHGVVNNHTIAELRSGPIADIDTLLGLGGSDSEVKWHYHLPTGPTTTFVLDTRTRREYASLNSPPGLLTESALEEQIPAINPAGTAPFVFCVSAAPAPGLASFEELVQPAAAAVVGISNASDSNPGVLQGRIKYDYEAWGFNSAALEGLLERLALHKKVIVFSGDVHYGFSSALDYWKGTRTAPEARILTFTSSSAKNEAFGLLHMYRSALVQKLLTGLGDNLEKLGWKDRVLSVTGPVSIRNRQRLRENPAVIPTAGWLAGSRVNRAPDFRWRLQILTDEEARPGDPVTTDIVLANDASTEEGYDNAVIRHQENFVTGVHRRMVWPSNVGLLRFEGQGDALKARHDYLFVAGSRDHTAAKPKAHVKHEALLVATGDQATRPELP